MNNQHETLWAGALNLLKNEVTEISYNTWINTIEPIAVDNNVFILGVPTDFNKGILESRYLPLISNSLKQLSLRDLSIKFVITDEYKNETKKTRNHSSQPTTFSSVLNPKYTFDSFVVGKNNSFAHAAAVAVAESPAKAYNPLFLYGGTGLGKTHLMHAIGHHIMKKDFSHKVIYITSEKFTNELVNAIRDEKNEEFRNRYRNIDVLLVDDIQFISGKESTQEEFFHTFNTLYEANKQIIVCSDKPPRDINPLEERLRSRFEWGLIADIQKPDLETRHAILKKRAQLENLIVEDEVLSFIASKIESNIRELEGALTKVIAFSSLTNKQVTIGLAKEALKDILSNTHSEITSFSIIETVSRYFDISPSDIQSSNRSRNISYPRQIAMYLCRTLTNLSLPKIGDIFGGRDHTTVIHACSKITNELKTKYETKKIVEEIKKSLGA